MTKPKYSVIIPTRNRHLTLRGSLKACVALKYPDCEILVADNCCTVETKSVVEEFNDPRIRYIRSETPLAMHDNWNFAVNCSKGEYVTIIGDDDALCPSALLVLDKIINDSCERIIQFRTEQFFWKSFDSHEEKGITDLIAFSNISLEKYHSSKMDGHKEITDLRDAKGWNLPMIYTSIFHRSVIEKMKQKTGKMFNTLSPDVYSGILAAMLFDSYIKVNMPIAVRGTSQFSNGDALTSGYEDENSLSIVKDFFTLARKSNVIFHPCVPQVPSVWAALFETLFHVRDLYPEVFHIKICKKKMIKAIYSDLNVRHKSPNQRDCIYSVLKQFAVPIIGNNYAEKLELKSKKQNQVQNKNLELSFGFLNKGFLRVKASEIGIQDVADAARVVEHFYGIHPEKFVTSVYKASWKDFFRDWLPPKFVRIGRRFISQNP